MKTSKLIITLAAGAALWSCNVKDPIYDTEHPDQGHLTIITDWSRIGSDVVKPTSWLGIYNDQTVTITADTYTFPNLLDPGNYTIYFHNEPEQITVSGNTATVASSGGYISSLPGWLFSGVLEAEIEADTDHEYTVVMNQQVRQLTLIIEPTGDATDKVTGITATLSGVAGSLDLSTGTHGTTSEIELDFTKISTGVDAGKWSATVRLLGITGTTQMLTGTISFADGNPETIVLDSDLSPSLQNFNIDKPNPLTLGGTVVETPTTAGITVTIEAWTPGQGQSGTAI